MVNPRLIRDNPGILRQGWFRRGIEAPVDRLVELDEMRRSLIAVVESAKADRNAASAEVGRLKRAGLDATDAIKGIQARGDEQDDAERKLAGTERELEEILLGLPNLPAPDVPDGRHPDDNVVVRTWGVPGEAAPWARDHLQIGEALGLFDFRRGAKIAGAGFPVYTGWGARLERALVTWFLDEHRAAGFEEVQPPLLVNRASMRGTGNLPKFADQLYTCPEDELYLIPTAEVPVTNLHAGEILETASLPVRYCSYTPCFRREAGSYGKDTKGFLRLHQFDKVEMVWFSAPDQSEAAHDALTAQAENLLRGLGLPFRTILLCAGDLGFGAQKCFDIEVWAPVERRWLEVSSCSNFGDFQSRRADIRVRGADGKPILAHTLNGSGLATPRILVALLEHGQREDGSVEIPVVLRPYLDGRDCLGPGRS